MGRTRTATLTLKGLAFSRMVALQFLARLWNARRAAPAGLQGPWRPRRPSSALCARQGAALGTVSAARGAPSGFEPRTPAYAAHFARLSKSRFICRLVALASWPLRRRCSRRGGDSLAGPPWSVGGVGWYGSAPAQRSRRPIGPLLAKTTTPRVAAAGRVMHVFPDALRRMRVRLDAVPCSAASLLYAVHSSRAAP